MSQGITGKNWLHAAGGFVLMGAWAMVANRAHGWTSILSSGIVQGIMSATITLVMKQLIEALARRSSGWQARVAPPLACFALSVALLSTIHTIIGTPEILATMFVPVTVATVYAAIYTQKVVADPGLMS